MRSPMSPSGSQRKTLRSFKARRASIACRRCRRLKKSCHPTGGGRCERCCQSDEVCAYVPVPEDPSAPHPAGSSSTVLVPDSPTIIPTEPLTPSLSFDLYLPDPQNEFHSAPHTRINHPPFHSTHPMHNSNPQSAGLSIAPAPIFAQQPPIYPPDVFSQHPFDPIFPSIYDDGLCDDGSQGLSVQTPLPSTTNHQHSAEDVVDPRYAHPYLRSTPDPSLQTYHLDNFTITNPAPLSINHNDTTSDFFPVASTSNPNHYFHLNMLTSSQSPTSYFEDSDFCLSSKLPCCFCSPGSEDCALHSPVYSYRCESSTEDEMED